MKHATPRRRLYPAAIVTGVAAAILAPLAVNAATPTISRTDAQAAADVLTAYLAQPEPTVTVTETATVTATPTASPSGPSPSSTPTATPTPTPTVTGTVGGLRYAPPALTNPVTIQIAAGGGSYSASSTTDCIFVAPQVVTGPITLTGCDDRVFIGGIFQQSDTTPTGSYDSTRRGIRLYDTGSSATGTDFLEGLWFRAGKYSDAIQIAHRSTSRTVVLQNIRIDAYTWGTQAGVHADTLQCWGGPSVLHVYNLTALRATYQGVYCDQNDGRAAPSLREPWTFDNVNIVGVADTGGARYMFADRRPGQTRATASNMWISGSPYSNADSFGNAPEGVRVGTVSDMVPAALWAGGAYTSPGYTP